MERPLSVQEGSTGGKRDLPRRRAARRDERVRARDTLSVQFAPLCPARLTAEPPPKLQRHRQGRSRRVPPPERRAGRPRGAAEAVSSRASNIRTRTSC